MKKEIIIAVISALIASSITYVLKSINNELNDTELELLSKKVLKSHVFVIKMVENLAIDDRFKGRDGENGINGIDGISNIEKEGTNWCGKLGEVNKICWGYQNLDVDTSHTRSFEFKFVSPFGSEPVVTNGINANGGGDAFMVYQNEISESKYSGSLIENNAAENNILVRMNYIAIGNL